MSGFYQRMKNVETYQYLSSSGYIVGQKNPLCTVLITLIKDAKNIIMQRIITKKFCKTAKADIKYGWLCMAKSASETAGEQMIPIPGYVIFLTGRVATTPSILFWRVKIAVQNILEAKLIRYVPVLSSLKYIWLLLLVLKGSCFSVMEPGPPSTSNCHFG